MPAQHVHTEDHGAFAVVRIEHGSANTLTPEICRTLAGAMRELGAKDKAVVLTGANKMFSAGVDLPSLLNAGPEGLDEFRDVLVAALGAVFHHPRPTVAAINGNAIGGGAVLAAACDYRLMAWGAGRIGTPELKAGIPFPQLALDILRHTCGTQNMAEITLRGALYTSAHALARGLVTEVSDPAGLMESATEVARELAHIPADLYAWTKRQLRGGTEPVDGSGAHDQSKIVARVREYTSTKILRLPVSRNG